MWKEGAKVVFSKYIRFITYYFNINHVDAKVKERETIVLAAAAATLLDGDLKAKL
jgi:hypothetical protein